MLQNIGEAFRRLAERSRAGRYGQAALSGSKPKSPRLCRGNTYWRVIDPHNDAALRKDQHSSYREQTVR